MVRPAARDSDPRGEKISARPVRTVISVAVGLDGDAITSLLRGPDGNRRRADFDIRAAVAQHAERSGSGSDLDQITPVFQLAHANLGGRTQANHVAPVELDFGTAVRARGQMIVHHQGAVQGGRAQFPRIAAANGDVAIHQADARHAMLGRSTIVILLLLLRGLLLRGRLLRKLLLSRSR